MPLSAGRARWRSTAAWRSDISRKFTGCGWPGTVLCSPGDLPARQDHTDFPSLPAASRSPSSPSNASDAAAPAGPTSTAAPGGSGRTTTSTIPRSDGNPRGRFANRRYCQYWILGVPGAQPHDPPPVQGTWNLQPEQNKPQKQGEHMIKPTGKKLVKVYSLKLPQLQVLAMKFQ